MAITTAEALRHMIHQQRHVATLRLELGEESDLLALAREVGKLKSARSVVIGSEEDMTDMSEPNWMSTEADELFSALGRLQLVEEIQLQDLGITFGPQGPRFPVALLTRLLRGNGNQLHPTLKRLGMGLRLVGNASEFQELADCLRLQKSLRRVSWEEWCFPTTDEGNDPAFFDINPIVSALAALPKLDSLSIKAMTAGSRKANLGSLNESALVELCQSPTLRQLQLAHFRLSSKAVRAAAVALRENKTMQLLSLDLSKTGPSGALSLFDMLRYNQKLTDFQIWASTQPCWAKNHCLIHLAKALTENSSVKTLAVLTHSRTLAEAMKNLTVVDGAIARAFVQMLETNCTLENLVLDDYGEELARRGGQSYMSILQFYLALNRSKRRQHLLQKYHTYTREDWTELLAMAIKSDREIRLEAVHYFLRLNPSLCQVN